MCLNNKSQEMGFPIQKFPDQSLFAAPRNLSQRTTSFIASQRQGIHRIPLRHLIVLEIRKRTTSVQKSPSEPTPNVFDLKFFEKTSFASNTSRNLRSGKAHDWYALGSASTTGYDLGLNFRPLLFAQRRLFRRDWMCFLFTMSICFGHTVRVKPVGISIPQGR